jgi:S-DNA-T family DNA segregation ATPase FtsK/SpoIIIE
MASRRKGEHVQGASRKGEPNRGSWLDVAAGGFALLEDFGAVVLFVLGLVSLLGLAGLTHGSAIDWWVHALRRLLGVGAWLVPIVLGLAAYGLLRVSLGRPWRIPWAAVIALEIAIVGALGLLGVLQGLNLPAAEAGAGGGVVGWGIARLLRDVLGAVLGTAVLVLVTAWPAVLALRGFLSMARIAKEEAPPRKSSAARQVQRAEKSQPSAPVTEAPEEQKAKPARSVPREFRKSFRVGEAAVDKPGRPKRRDDRLPPLSLLESSEPPRITSKEINQAAGLIEKTLADFGLPARVVDFKTGPAVTQFAVEPGFIEHEGADGEARKQKVRVSQISALANDLALALSSPSIRIEAPVPGQAYVGIEVPNRRAAVVRLAPILESEAFQSIASPLAIALGRDVAGAPISADLAAMPHLLIAGTTGSGKSVCITALATCLVLNNAPDEMRLVMIDPKMVELVRFNGLPHLLGKVETQLERIIGVLRWCTVEMDRRYRLLEQAKARDIEVFNRKAGKRKDLERLPRIVVFIDELADLMMMAPDQTERTLVRLAQMARAVGIHLVVATQRPSTDIVTGLIKANFPARLSFAVASGVDSRVILDGGGAETLLGRGDMLFLSPEASAPVRLQGALVTDVEVDRIVSFWREEEGEPVIAARRAPWEDLLTRQEASAEADDVLQQAIELVKKTGQASASMLQRRLRIGYPRAARLMDELEELGLVGRAQSGGRTREVLRGEATDGESAEDEDDT